MFIDAKEPFDREVLRFEGWRVWCRRAIIGDTGWEVDMAARYVCPLDLVRMVMDSGSRKTVT
jgi:hypothetical protein